MARDGSGNYALPALNPVVNATVISPTWANNTMTDIATALTASLTADGQKTATANQPMGGFKHTNIADGNARNTYSSVGQLQDGSLVALGSVSGTDTITAALTPAITSYATGMALQFKPAATNTGAVTIAINSLAAKAVVKWSGSALVAGDLVTSIPATIIYDGTSFILQNPQILVPADYVSFARMQNIATDRLIGRDTASSGDPEEISLGASLEFSGSGSIQRAALTGDVTASANSNTTTIANDAVTNAKVANMAQATVKGRQSGGGTGDPEDLTAAQLVTIINTADGASSGLDADLLDGVQLSALGGNTTGNIGYLNIPANGQAGNYTLVLGDAGKHIYHGSADGSGDTYTIPANASVAFPVGTAVTFVNSASAAVSIAITTDTMTLAGTTTTGTRTLAQNGIATALKVTSTAWIISGSGLT